MAHARHKAPRKRTSFTARRNDAGLLLAGGATLATTFVGASVIPSYAPEPSAVSIGLVGLGSVEAPSATELADLRDERQASILAASRGSDRLSMDIAPPRTVLVLPAPAGAVPPATPPVAAPLPATTPAYADRAVNVRAAASQDSPVVAVLEAGDEVAVTGVTQGDYAQIVLAGKVAWVYASYVAAKPPAVAQAPSESTPSGVSGAPCGAGSSVESGLASNAIAVHRAVCALFPSVSSYGGLRPGDGGEHGSGHALDIMISSDTGTEIASYLQAHAAELGVIEVIWRQRIWSTQRAGDGWRFMEDRGSATANHYDHVHVTVS